MKKLNGDIREFPRILVISNNSFSDTKNNGKTLASFFEDIPKEKIAQLYFNSELPDNTYFEKYFRITDSDIIQAVTKNNDSCGEVAYQQPILKESKYSGSFAFIKRSNVARIAREAFWASKRWQTKQLSQWLDEISPEIIFFCAGDSGFTYDITEYIQKQYNSKLVVYITDDYILPRRTISPFWWVRRNYIVEKMRAAISRSDLFVTISEQMRYEYKNIFGKDSISAVNITESMREEHYVRNIKNNLNLVYAGGLHFKRYVTLGLLAQSLKNYNANHTHNKKVYLKIYSTQVPSKKMLNYLNILGVSEFCGGLDAKQLKDVLNSCDIPVHVESFDRKSIESTKLSISTKIPEYLSLGKPILAIGPSNIASMQYLKDCALCITDKKSIESELIKLFGDNELRGKLSKEAYIKYENNHIQHIVANQLISDILELVK